jgi:hypothetical protein
VAKESESPNKIETQKSNFAGAETNNEDLKSQLDNLEDQIKALQFRNITQLNKLKVYKELKNQLEAGSQINQLPNEFKSL